jgi:hypothetical protein
MSDSEEAGHTTTETAKFGDEGPEYLESGWELSGENPHTTTCIKDWRVIWSKDGHSTA